jgi:hypothetical protein
MSQKIINFTFYISRSPQCEAKGQQMIGPESGIYALRPPEAANEQTRTAISTTMKAPRIRCAKGLAGGLRF